MKTLHYINLVSFTITLLLYITIFYGMIAQVFLGTIQVILALILLLYWKTLKSRQKKLLAVYAFVAILYGLLWLTDIVNTDFAIAFITVIPMSIAAYFLYITAQIKKINNYIN